MEQRPLRLGDIVDDYCPRERRITNHAIVAIVETVIRQTRCTTCDSEHVYKEARVPRRRRGEAADDPAEPAAARPESDAVGSSEPDAPGFIEADDRPAMSAEADPDADGADRLDEAATADDETAPSNGSEDAGDDRVDEGWWPAHRRLIRATLPRVEGDTPARPIPEFTMHQRQTRGGNGFRGGSGWQGGNGQGGSRNGFRQGRSGHGGGGDDGGQGNGQERSSGRRGRSGRHRGQNKRSR